MNSSRPFFFAMTALGMLLLSSSAQADPGAHQRSYELEAKKDYAGALQVLEGMSSGAQRSYLHALRRGWLSYLLGRYPQSIAGYKQATRRAAGAVEPLLGLMLPQMAQRAWADAAKTGRKALALDADNYLATSRLALSSYYLGRYAESARLYQRLVQLYPGDVTMRAGLGWALLKQRKRPEAARVFRQVLTLAPKNASAKAGLTAAGG